MHAHVKPDLIANVLDLNTLPSANHDEIIAQDVLEHFHWRETPRALFEWNRLLKKGGSLFIRTTYLIGLMKRFEYDVFQGIPTQKVLLANLFSQQLMPGDYHLTAFSERLLRYYLWETGFDISEMKIVHEWLFDVRAEKAVEYYDEAPSLSNDDFVRKVIYNSILGREPDEAGLHGWVQKLVKSEIDRQSLIRTALLSPEREKRMEVTCPHFDLEFDKPHSVAQ